MFASKQKEGFQFKVHFDHFGNEDAEYLMAHVRRVLRPGFRTVEVIGIIEPEFTSVEIDVLDDVNDRMRGAVMLQLYQQQTQDAEFSLVIETRDRGLVCEQWMLSGCRLAQVSFDELAAYASGELRIHLVISAKRIATTASGLLLELV